MLSRGWIERIGLLIISIMVVSGLLAGDPTVAKADTPDSVEPYVNLYGQRTDVLIGDEVILILSVVNPITSPNDLIVQLTLNIPSGWSVTSTEFGSAVGGLPTAVYETRKGTAQQISVHLLANEPYQGEIIGYIDYYFAGDQAKHHDQVNLPVTARQQADKQDTATNGSGSGIPWVIVGIVLGVLSVAGLVTMRLIL
jgi:hypothetical protein